MRSRTRRSRAGTPSSATLWPAAGAVLLYLAIAVPQLDRPLIYDEVDFAKAGHAITGGHLQYDRGYIADYESAPDAAERYQYALWHPPGYVLALGAWERLLGTGVGMGGDTPLRLFGLLCGLLSLICAVALAMPAGGPGAAALAAVLWATSPYAIQSALLLDIDGTVLAPATAIFVWLALAASGEGRRGAHASLTGAAMPAEMSGEVPFALHCSPPGTGTRDWVRGCPIAAAFGLALWCKLTVPLVAAGALVAWLAATGRRGAAGRLALACLAGGLLFAVSWSGFAAAGGLPLGRPFQDTWHELLEVAGVGTGLGTGLVAGRAVPPLPLVMLVAALRSAQWLHPLTLCLLVAAPLAIRRSEPVAALLVVAATSSVVALAKLAGGFPKYHAGTWPIVAAVLGVALARWLGPGRGLLAAWLAGGIVTGAGLTTLTGGDALIRAVDLRLLIPWLAVGAASLPLARRLGPSRPAALILGLLLGANLITSFYQLRLSGSTTYFYGARGQAAAGAWLQTFLSARTPATPAASPVVADREVAYYAGPVHFIDSERFLDLLSAGGGEGWSDPLPEVEVVASRHRQVDAVLPLAFRQVAVFGDYQVWQRTPPSGSSVTSDDVATRSGNGQTRGN